MFTLQPRETLPLVRVLTDPTDSTTYYVRAVVRNAKTLVTLTTLTLTDNGNRIFSNNYLVPADPSGRGFFIAVTTQVFTDAGMTTPSAYNDETETYVIYDRMSFAHAISNYLGAQLAGDGLDIDYKKIGKMLAEISTESLAKILKEIETVKKAVKDSETEKTDLEPVLSAISEVKNAVQDLDIPEFEPTDLQPVLESIQTVLTAVGGIKFEQKDLDLSPVLEALKKFDLTEVNTKGGDISKVAEKLLESTQKLPEALKQIDDIKTTMKEFLYIVTSEKRSGAGKQSEQTHAINRAGRLIKIRKP